MAAPMMLPQLQPGEPMPPMAMEPIEVPQDDGGMVLEFPGNKPGPSQVDPEEHDQNLAETLDDSVLASLYGELSELIEDDMTSRQDWNDTAAKALDLLGLKILDGKSAHPFEGASRATDTLLLETLMSWQATALAETMPLTGPAQGEPSMAMPVGTDPKLMKELMEANKRAEEYVNDVLTSQLRTYLPRHDRMLFDLGLLGSGFKKIYDDPSTPVGLCVDMVPPEDLIASYHADGVSNGRVTHRSRLSEDQLNRKVVAGIYLEAAGDGETSPTISEVEMQRDEAAGQSADGQLDREYVILECHCDLVLEGDEHPEELARPYIVVLDETTTSIRAIYRNWKVDDVAETRRVYFARYALLPAKSMVYGFGLGHLLGNTTHASQDALRHAMNAALLANLPAGFKHANLSIRDEQRPLDPGEFRDVDSPTGNVADSFSALPFRGPDQTLVLLRESLQEAGRRVAGQTQLNVAQTLTGNTPVGTAIAALDEASRIPGSIQRRIWQSLKDELAIIRDVLLDVLPQDNTPRKWGNGKQVTREDINLTIFMPAMRPGAPTRVHRIAEAQAVIQLATQLPNLHNMPAAVLRFYNAIGVHEPEALMAPEPDKAQPADPITEMTNALAGKPLVAGLSQDHPSHITSHAAQMQMLQMQPALGEAAQSASGSLQAHIADHFSKQITLQAAQLLGIPLEQLAQGMPPELEMQVAPQVAQAMQAILEQMPKPPDPAQAALEVEKLKQAGAMQREEKKAETRLTEAQLGDSEAQLHETSETERNTADNETALAIAALKLSQPDVHPDAPTNNNNPGEGGR